MEIDSLSPTPGLGTSVKICSYAAGDVDEKGRLALVRYDVRARFVLDVASREHREKSIVV
jgi:hypothetical protein